MSDTKPIPRRAVLAAGWLIFLAAAAGLTLGLARNIKGLGGGDSDLGEIVAPIKSPTNAQPLTAPPVTEADVRRWTREEMQVSAAPRAAAEPTKRKADDGVVAPDPNVPSTAQPFAQTQPAPPPPPPPAPKPVQPTQQIPF